MSKEEKKPEEQPLVVNTSLISGKSPEIVNLPKDVEPVEDSSPSKWAKELLDTVKDAARQAIAQPPEAANPVPTPQASDKTVPGGRYIVGGQLVNANGDPIKE